MISALWKGVAMGLLLSISVGPIIFAIIRQCVIKGHKNGLFFVMGVSCSDITVVLVCNVFTQLFQSAISHEKIIGMIGSLFLLALGVYYMFFRTGNLEKEVVQQPELKQSRSELASAFLGGYFMNILNPGVFIFWFAASAALMSESQTSTHPLRYRATAFITCLLFVLGMDILKVFLSGKIRHRLTPHNIHMINKLSGAIMAVFGLILFYSVYTGKIIQH